METVTEAHTLRYPYTRPERMPPRFREEPLPHFFGTRVVVFRLEAYWRGKLHGAL